MWFLLTLFCAVSAAQTLHINAEKTEEDTNTINDRLVGGGSAKGANLVVRIVIEYERHVVISNSETRIFKLTKNDCLGTIIASTKILTTSTCLDIGHYNGTPNCYVQYYPLESNTLENATFAWDVSNIYRTLTNFSEPLVNNIAIIFLEESIQINLLYEVLLTPYIHPYFINLFFSNSNKLAVIGNNIFAGGNFDPIFTEGAFLVTNNIFCKNQRVPCYNNTDRFPGEFNDLTKGEFCVNINQTYNKICYGDEGGPVLHPMKSVDTKTNITHFRYVLIGLINYIPKTFCTGAVPAHCGTYVPIAPIPFFLMDYWNKLSSISTT